jgi:osmoprotectant transport system permease protein
VTPGAAIAHVAIAALLAATGQGAALAAAPAPQEQSTGAAAPASSVEPVRIGSKRFTESYVLAEIVRGQLERAGRPATHRAGLGNTAILFAALRSGAIDLYPEYTGTVARELLGIADGDTRLDALNDRLGAIGLALAVPFGFSNTYAIAVDPRRADALGLATLSDLARHPALRVGVSHEFLVRADGWPAIARAYGLPQRPSGVEHGLAYEALAARRIDATDVYATDAKIRRYGLRVLADDRGVFPRYDAMLLHRVDLEARHPGVLAALMTIAGSIDAERMQALNAAVELDGASFAGAAERYFASERNARPSPDAPRAAEAPAEARPSLLALLSDREFERLAREHLALVAASVLAAAVLGVPLGILAARRRALAGPVLGLVGVLQTIPSLALLALLVALLGRIGTGPALVALFLYALLPIVTSTHAGLAGVPPGLVQAGTALGLRPLQVLRTIELPLALPLVLTGIQTAAVIAVGTATIAAFVGAGGFGERIASGLALNDPPLLLAGAIPAAVLALLVQASFGVAIRLTRAARARGVADRRAA